MESETHAVKALKTRADSDLAGARSHVVELDESLLIERARRVRSRPFTGPPIVDSQNPKIERSVR
jgi:hypothetical protein